MSGRLRLEALEAGARLFGCGAEEVQLALELERDLREKGLLEAGDDGRSRN
jgi:hypothetical protein